MESKADSETLVDHLKKELKAVHVSSHDLIGVAYSGGRDSALLLWAVSQVHPRQNIQAIYVNHGWRSFEELKLEGELVERFCERLGVALNRFGPPVVAFEGNGAEDRARKFRYSCFERCARENGLNWILTAHHQQDQAETVLMRLLQGRSWSGLSGIRPRRGIFLRPFLEMGPQTLQKAAQALDLEVSEDSTNKSVRYLRNFLRTSIWPVLKSRFPHLDRSLQEFSNRWAQFVTQASPEWVREAAGFSISLSTWESWSVDERVEQLVALLPQMGTEERVSRSFLRTICRNSERQNWKGEGGGFRLFSTSSNVSWERVVQTPTFHYFIYVRQKNWYALPDYSFVVSEQKTSQSDLFLPGGQSQLPLVWKTAREGEQFAVSDTQRKGKKWHRRLTREDRSEPLAFVYQSGLLLAVVDPAENRRIWPPDEESKLNLFGIFVKLVQRRHS